jgi:glycosyltransferase involved in cell wall biosynthesis
MHIAVDGSSWGGEERGVAVASRRLWSAFLERTSARVTVIAPAELGSDMARASHLVVGTLKGASRLAWQQFRLPALVREQGIDVLHCPSYTAPLAVSCKLIVTVHDLIAWTHPGLAGWRNALHLHLLVGRSVRRAQSVCVPTEFVRQAVITQFGIPRTKVFVVPWGVDAELTPLSEHDAIREIRRRFGVDEPFVLFCGCIEAKKNLLGAVRAAAAAGVLLLVVGPCTARSSAILAEMHRSEAGRWRYLGYVSTSDLSALYSAALALVYPSHVEGFGLPTIEAMRCGCPVIASNTPAVREVCGGAAMLVQPSEIAELAASVRAVASDRGLRESLKAGGIARAAHFTWAVAIERFAEAVAVAAR